MVEDVLLLCALLAVFWLCFFLMKKVDQFVDENRQAMAAESMGDACLVHIAAQTPMLVSSAAPAMEYCSRSHPAISFSVGSGTPHALLEMLRAGTADLILLSDDAPDRCPPDYQCIRIPYLAGSVTAGDAALPVADLEAPQLVRVLWNPALSSAARDRVVFALCNAPAKTRGRRERNVSSL